MTLADEPACRCVPLYPPSVVYQALMMDSRSRVAACNASASLPSYQVLQLRVQTVVQEFARGCSRLYSALSGTLMTRDTLQFSTSVLAC